nr:cysteine hydrolase family protein [uncultured Dongia sp.]
MTKRALIVIDVQNDYFPGGKWTLSGIDAAADNVARLIAAARKAGELIVHIRHEFDSNDAPFFVAGSDGAAIHTKASPAGNETVILKNHVNAFRETDLKAVLDKHGITDLVICGAMSHMCVDAATRAANDFGYSNVVIHDACASRDLEFNGIQVPAVHAHAAFMAALGSAYAKMLSTAEFLNPTVQAA